MQGWSLVTSLVGGISGISSVLEQESTQIAIKVMNAVLNRCLLNLVELKYLIMVRRFLRSGLSEFKNRLEDENGCRGKP